MKQTIAPFERHHEADSCLTFILSEIIQIVLKQEYFIHYICQAISSALLVGAELALTFTKLQESSYDIFLVFS
jgi:predicted neutral ceramidase superfamily lipid hydrolase